MSEIISEENKTIRNLIDELIIIRSATHTQKDYNCFTIAIEKAKEYLPENDEIQDVSPLMNKCVAREKHCI